MIKNPIITIHMLLAGLLAGSIPISGFGQTPSQNGVIRCLTTEMEAHRHADDPQGAIHQFEEWMAKSLKDSDSNPTTKGVNASRIIPTVVHVIYSNATDPDNISDAQIFSQMDILNEDFQRLNPDTTNTPAAFQSVAVDSDIEFCLASLDPGGNPTNGINRVQIAGSPFTTNFVENTIKPSTIWDPNNYFNIWICNISGGVLGYAQFPEAAGLPGIGTGNGGATTDGVVLLYSSVGRPPANPFGGPYNRGRTATHEVGHWLGLRHIWGDGGCTVDDFCNDTPESDGSNFGCPTTHSSCGTTDMVQNYMDYTDDDCMNIFTADQKARMDIVMGSSIRRASLLSSTVCDLSPAINFQTATTSMTENSSSGNATCRGYQDIDITLTIGGPPTGDANVALNTVSSSALNTVDYDVLIGAVTFADGATANQNFRIRVYDDEDVELVENLTIGFTITGTTDAFPGTVTQHSLDINDDDLDPGTLTTGTVYSEDFEAGAPGWGLVNGGGTNQWAFGANGAMNGTNSVYISRNGGAAHAYQANSASASRLVSPLIDATGFFGLNLSFLFHSNGQVQGGTLVDYGTLSYSLDGTTFTVLAGSNAASPFQGVSANTTYSIALPTDCNNTSFYLSWEWYNDGSIRNNPPFAVDDILIEAPNGIPVESDLNSSNTEYLGPNATVFWYDQTSGEVMARISNTSAHDYGCTQVQVDRAGTGATLYMDATMPYACADKTFMVTPTNNNAAGAYNIRLYYSQAEILGWEAATGQLRANANVAKTNGPIANITPATPTANGPGNVYGSTPGTGTFSTNDWWVEADFNTGFSGFSAGIENPTIVPVEFAYLNARWEQEDGHLTWELGDYANLRHFVVERQADNGDFVRLGEVFPNASSGTGTQFEFVDAGAFRMGAQQLNYRVRSVDFDGQQSFSKIASLRPGQRLELLAWPNPFREQLSVQLDLPDAGQVRLQLINPLGQVIIEAQQYGQAGSNRLELDFAGQQLPQGVYFLQASGNGFAEQIRVIKQ